MLTVKLIVTDERNNDIFAKETKIDNVLYHNNERVDCRFIKCYIMSHNDSKTTRSRLFREIKALSVFVNENIANIVSLDDIVNNALSITDSAEKSLDAIITDSTASTVKTAKKDKTKKDVKSVSAIDKLKASQARIAQLAE